MIYFIRAKRHLKIGYSKDPYKRLKELQTGNPIKLEMLLVMEGGFETEKALHDYYSKYRTEGEWFELRKGSELKNSILALSHPACKWKSPKNIKQFIENGLHYYLIQKSKRSPRLKKDIEKFSAA